MSIQDQVLGVIRRIVGTQMIVDILREQRRADDWAPHITSSVLVAELQRRLASRPASGESTLDDELRGHLLSIIGARLGASASHDTHMAAKQAFNTLIAGAHPDALAVAEVIALDFREELRDPGLPLDVACRYYDILYGLYWCGAQRFTDMARFDTKAVIPFAEWLRRHYPPLPASRPLPQPGQPLRVGYLCTYAHLERGNAIAPLVRSIVVEHARRPDRNVFMYCVQWSSPDFVAGFAETGVTVRDLPQGDAYASLDGIVEAIRTDGIDVLITDVGSAVSTYVFSRRAAPVHMWIDMGYPFWSIEELDWALSGMEVVPGYWGIPQGRYSLFTMRIASPGAARAVTDAELAAARAAVPANRFLMACFTRLVKVTPAYVRVVRQLLRDIPGSHYLLVGGGISVGAERLASDAEFVGRVTLVRGMVDLAVYGRIVDVFLDTFPLSAGVVAVEMAARGIPVVSLDGGDADRDHARQRDAQVLARSEAEYCAIVERIASDAEFGASCREGALALGRRFMQVEGMIGPIEQGISKALDHAGGRETQRANRRG